MTMMGDVFAVASNFGEEGRVATMACQDMAEIDLPHVQYSRKASLVRFCRQESVHFTRVMRRDEGVRDEVSLLKLDCSLSVRQAVSLCSNSSSEEESSSTTLLLSPFFLIQKQARQCTKHPHSRIGRKKKK